MKCEYEKLNSWTSGPYLFVNPKESQSVSFYFELLSVCSAVLECH